VTPPSGCDRLGAAARGENPTVLRRLRTGWAVIDDAQLLPGYCLLLYDGEAEHLDDLPLPERTAFLVGRSMLGEAVRAACSALDPDFRRERRDPRRPLTAPAQPRPRPICMGARAAAQRPGRPLSAEHLTAHPLSERHDIIRAALTRELDRVTAAAS
jgi:hypothetical protein